MIWDFIIQNKMAKKNKEKKLELILKKSVMAFWKLYKKGLNVNLSKEEYKILKSFS